MVGDGCELRRSRFTGQNVQILVKLERVPADDFGLEALRHVDRPIGFAYRRGARQHHVPQFAHVKCKDPRSAKRTRVIQSCKDFDQIRLLAPCQEFWHR